MQGNCSIFANSIQVSDVSSQSHRPMAVFSQVSSNRSSPEIGQWAAQSRHCSLCPKTEKTFLTTGVIPPFPVNKIHKAPLHYVRMVSYESPVREREKTLPTLCTKIIGILHFCCTEVSFQI